MHLVTFKAVLRLWVCALVGLTTPPDVVGQDEGDLGYTSRTIVVGGDRIQYLDFGGNGLPLIFTAGTRPAETWAGFAGRFVDEHRALAITDRGVVPSEGEWGGVVTRGQDILSLMDSLRIDRAVLIANSNPTPVLTYLGEHHPRRLAGLIFLAPESERANGIPEDPTGANQMLDRLIASVQEGRVEGRDADSAGDYPDEQFYRPKYLDTDAPTIYVPALTFLNLDGTRGLERSYYTLQVAEMVNSGAMPAPDSVSRKFFEQLAANESMQAQVKTVWDTLFAPIMLATERRFLNSFGSLHVARVDVPIMNGAPVVTGYEYRDAPELIYLHIRRFLDGIKAR
jgi:pimeloyl-ACP methyl ester carboxylesterase